MQIIKFLCKTSSKTLQELTEIIKYLVKSVKIRVFLMYYCEIPVQITGNSHMFLTFLIPPTFPVVLALHVLISLQC